MKKTVVIGTRNSKLALYQAELVAARFREQNPEVEITITSIATKGDRYSQLPFPSTETGIFTKELEQALLDSRIDVAVHSLKDLPVDIPDGLFLAAVLERADPRDVLVSKLGNIKSLPQGSKIYTSSMRRIIQLNNYRPDLQIAGIRGNIDTRINRVYSEDLTGLIIAAAGVIRLGMESKISEYLPLEYFLPAPGQGAIAVEIRADDLYLFEPAAHINHIKTWQSITAERVFLKSLGGGCRTPIGALASFKDDKLQLTGMVCGVKQKSIIKAFLLGNPLFPEALGKLLATKMVDMGAMDIINGDLCL
jgi:hydroxymethylbilane synthase